MPNYRFRNDFDHQFFGFVALESPIVLNRMIKRLMYWNREDLIRELHSACNQNNIQWVDQVTVILRNIHDPSDLGSARVTSLNAQWAIARAIKDEETQIPKVGGLERGRQAYETPQAFHPKPQLMTIHRGSVIAFFRGLVGHSFTGIVHISIGKLPRPHKVFLFPGQPTEGRSGHYPTRPHDENKEERVYGLREKPIKHTGMPSHAQLVGSIQSKEEYEDADQDAGNFVGFSVIKGDGAKYPNRYSFTSFSSNKPTFQQPHQRLPMRTSGSGSVPHDWSGAIQSCVDKLLQLETELLTGFGSKERAVASLDRDEALWMRLKHKYWMC